MPTLPAFDDHPGGAPGQILQGLLGQFLSRRLPLRILAANLGDGDKPRVARAIYDPSATVSGQVDRPLGDLDGPEPQLLRVVVMKTRQCCWTMAASSKVPPG